MGAKALAPEVAVEAEVLSGVVSELEEGVVVA